MTRRTFLASVVSIAAGADASANSISRSAAKITVSATVDLGAENGKNLGTIFQLRRGASNGIVAAVGVPQFFNHYTRSNPRMLHAHVRAASKASTGFTVRELGTPRTDTTRTSSFVLDGTLVDGINRQYFDEVSGDWIALPSPWHGATFLAGEKIGYASRVAGKVLISTDRGVFYDGVRIISRDGTAYHAGSGSVLYYDGRLFTNWDDGVLRTYAWTPGGAVGAPINSFNLISGHFLRAFGILGGRVYAVSGYGRVLHYDRAANNWAYVAQPESVNEFYSLMSVFNELRVGDYPNGDQWRLSSPSSLSRMSNWPPEEAGASSTYREVQSMCLYGGDEIAPTWPWGVVHRGRIETGTWSNHRLYSQPPVSGIEAPYLDVYGNNYWGQRLSCVGLYRAGVFLTASNKNANLLDPGQDTVPNKADYGKVWLLTRPHAFSAELDWKPGETTFSLEISAAGVILKQDGVTLGSVAGVAPSDFEGSDPITVDVGSGLYGSLEATLIGSHIDQQF